MDKRKKNLIITVVALFILIVVVPFTIYLFNALNNPNGDHLNIKNINEYTKGKPVDKDTYAFIEHALFTTVNMNTNLPVENKSVEDILVREKSFNQTFDKNTSIYSVDFIVDIKSLQQSYAVSYQWSSEDKHSAELSEWGTVVKCLPTEKLIYKDFNCKDMFTGMTDTTSDPKIAKALPYSTDSYTIRYYMEEDQTVISVQIMMNNNSDRTRARFDVQKSKALAWLKEQGIETNKYTVQYRNLSNTIVDVVLGENIDAADAH